MPFSHHEAPVFKSTMDCRAICHDMLQKERPATRSVTFSVHTIRVPRAARQLAARAEGDPPGVLVDQDAPYPVALDGVFDVKVKLTASDTAAHDQFGFSVSISGDTAIVGTQSDFRPAYIFQRDQGGADNWGEVKKLIASDAAVGDAFGRPVSISGDTAIVGAIRSDGVGSE